jgi:hypothetical protein
MKKLATRWHGLMESLLPQGRCLWYGESNWHRIDRPTSTTHEIGKCNHREVTFGREAIAILWVHCLPPNHGFAVR